MNYEGFSYMDFVEDEYFVAWVQNPDYESNLFWEKWLASHPEKAGEVQKARAFIEQMDYGKNFDFSEEDFMKVHENIVRYQSNYEFVEQEAQQSRFNWRRYAAAAAVLLIICAAVAWRMWVMPAQQGTEQTVLAYKTTHTNPGVKHKFTLPDGSIVKLNSESSLKYPDSFAGEQREVFLEGEAFFEVVENPEKPFIVHTPEFDIEVKGTSFNLHAYENEAQKVAVVTGAVAVFVEEGDAGMLCPRQMALMNQNSKSIEIEAFNPEKEIAWRENILYFNNQPLKAVFKTLERWYGVKIKIQKPGLLNERYEGEYNNEPLSIVLDGIGYTSGFEYEIQGKTVTIF
mgnify:CR=1 FL=1